MLKWEYTENVSVWSTWFLVVAFYRVVKVPRAPPGVHVLQIAAFTTAQRIEHHSTPRMDEATLLYIIF